MRLDAELAFRFVSHGGGAAVAGVDKVAQHVPHAVHLLIRTSHTYCTVIARRVTIP